ncbi:two-component system, response regulator YesN [Amphibacillus marinus]|uniref:Two-component system, response regulator YesN n=1 Tax=Amphibacillus marinus TaxID=872970 RepID=A0A1H8L4F6_9BACI|nr:response regulator [Amphibacillus marinus]SEO00090.1 two-component system, response regulator YesN [Amphibacillus marinus]
MYKVIIVEDEALIRKRLVYGLDYEKYNCLVVGEARDGEEGTKLIKELEPDIVLTDINMPIKNAFDMLEETLDYSYCTIILSSYNEFSNAQKAIKFGVTEFIVKPINERELYEALERAILQAQQLKIIKQLSYSQEALDELQANEVKRHQVHDEVVNEMIQFIRDHYSEKFVFDDVSKAIGYSSALLHDRFKKEVHTTFNDYLNRYRIRKSIEFILKGEKKVYEIAEDCGFSEYKYYNKVFKKYIGMSTKDFLEKL